MDSLVLAPLLALCSSHSGRFQDSPASCFDWFLVLPPPNSFTPEVTTRLGPLYLLPHRTSTRFYGNFLGTAGSFFRPSVPTFFFLPDMGNSPVIAFFTGRRVRIHARFHLPSIIPDSCFVSVLTNSLLCVVVALSPSGLSICVKVRDAYSLPSSSSTRMLYISSLSGPTWAGRKIRLECRDLSISVCLGMRNWHAQLDEAPIAYVLSPPHSPILRNLDTVTFLPQNEQSKLRFARTME